MRDNTKTFFIIATLVIICSIIIVGICSHFSRATYTVTITDKERVTGTTGKDVDSYYLVFTEMNGKTRVFKNIDSLLEFKFNSSDIQGQLKVGNTYQIRVYGWRVTLFSMYENIVSIEATIKAEAN